MKISKRTRTFSVLMGAMLQSTLSFAGRPTPLDEERAQAALKRLNDLDIIHEASVAPIKVKNARLILNNEMAFQSKLNAVRNSSREVKMLYYIYEDDTTSSAMTQALIEKAQSGVKVKILLDYFSAYNQLDLLSMMEREGRGNLEVRLYNRPTKTILEDVAYLTASCTPEGFTIPAGLDPTKDADCKKIKSAYVVDLFKNEGKITNKVNDASGLFLSGLYAKNPKLIATAFFKGTQMDLSKFTSGPKTSAQDKQAAVKLLKTYWKAKTGNLLEQVESRAELTLANLMYGDKIRPLLDKVEMLFPLSMDGRSGSSSGRDWAHITDYLHHKLLLVDQSSVQLGGRNIEDSYHMTVNSQMSKYAFMDTDFYADLASGGDKMSKSFDDLWNFSEMVAPISEVRIHAPNEVLANWEAFKSAKASCDASAKAQGAKSASEACIDAEFSKNYVGLQARLDKRVQEMKERAADYARYERPTNMFKQDRDVFELSDADKDSMLLAYVENLPFNKDVKPDLRTRNYGAVKGEESSSGKHIHQLWRSAMWNTCNTSAPSASNRAGTPKRVILHNAYFLPASNLIATFKDMISGRYDCSNVRVTILTNSFQSTDLGIINVLAKHQMKAFFEYYNANRSTSRGAVFEYYEYKGLDTGVVSSTKLDRNGLPVKISLSLHTKLTMAGDDMFIGSANADLRSFMMDTNNGMFIRGAKDLAAQYRDFVDSILEDTTRVENMTQSFTSRSREEMRADDMALLHERLQHYGVEKKLSKEMIDALEKIANRLTDDTYEMTRNSLSLNFSPSQGKYDGSFQPF